MVVATERASEGAGGARSFRLLTAGRLTDGWGPWMVGGLGTVLSPSVVRTKGTCTCCLRARHRGAGVHLPVRGDGAVGVRHACVAKRRALMRY